MTDDIKTHDCTKTPFCQVVLDNIPPGSARRVINGVPANIRSIVANYHKRTGKRMVTRTVGDAIMVHHPE